MDSAELQRGLDGLKDWRLMEDGKTIEKTFELDSYKASLDFAMAVGAIAEEENHHPDMVVSYKRVTVRYSTHSEGGISDKDFKCASKIDAHFS